MTDVPMIYDVSTDAMRPATQDDIDRLETFVASYGAFRYLLRECLAFPKSPEDLYPMYSPEDWKRHLSMLKLLSQKIDSERNPVSAAR